MDLDFLIRCLNQPLRDHVKGISVRYNGLFVNSNVNYSKKKKKSHNVQIAHEFCF